MREGGLVRWVLATACATLGGCSLLYPLDGYVGGVSDATEAGPFSEAGRYAADAEVDAAPGEDSGPPGTPCPSDMVDAGGFCIDRTEVTQADYQTFLASGSHPTLPSICTFNTSFEPGVYEGTASSTGCAPNAAHYSPTTTPTAPVACVDWCDATAFCLARGRRLCGAIGGGSVSATAPPDSVQRQWFVACSQKDKTSFPYGTDYMPGACQDNTGAAATVASHKGCEGGFPGLFDMSGNLKEWEDACHTTSGKLQCDARGGDFGNNTAATLSCAALDSSPPDYQSFHLGFRCCRD